MNDEPGVLTHDGGSDYTLNDDSTSVWITVKNLSVYVRKTDEGVVCDIFPKGREDEDSICSCYALDSDGEDDCTI